MNYSIYIFRETLSLPESSWSEFQIELTTVML